MSGQIILRKGKQTMELIATEANQMCAGNRLDGILPLGDGIERLVRCFCDNGHLITAYSVNESATFHYGF